MSQKVSLKETEQRVFRFVYQDGLWDICIGSFVLVFAIAPFLSHSLGDFWSTAVFVPFWAIVFAVAWLVRKRVVVPRVGIVTFGSWRKARMLTFSVVVLVFGLISLVLGFLSAVFFDAVPGWVHAARFSFIILVGFSLAGYFTGFKRLYLYGLLIALAPLAGEWFYTHTNIPHHGYPVTFGLTAGIAICIGLVKFIQVVRNHPLPDETPFAQEANGG